MARNTKTKSQRSAADSDVEALRAAIASLSAQTLASVGVKYLGEEGLERLVELLKERIAAVGGGDYLPLAGGTVTGDIVLGSSGARITAEGHIVLASGIEIY